MAERLFCPEVLPLSISRCNQQRYSIWEHAGHIPTNHLNKPYSCSAPLYPPSSPALCLSPDLICWKPMSFLHPLHILLNTVSLQSPAWLSLVQRPAKRQHTLWQVQSQMCDSLLIPKHSLGQFCPADRETPAEVGAELPSCMFGGCLLQVRYLLLNPADLPERSCFQAARMWSKSLCAGLKSKQATCTKRDNLTIKSFFLR